MSKIANYFKQSAQNIENLKTFENKILDISNEIIKAKKEKKNYLLQVMVVLVQMQNIL